MSAGLRVRRQTPVIARHVTPKGVSRPHADAAAMRRAAALYLLSREAVSRDVAFLLLPAADEQESYGKPAQDRKAVPARAVHPGSADLMVWSRGRSFVVGFAAARSRPRLSQQRFGAVLRDLGHAYRLIHAETPAHAVEQLVKLLEDSDR